MAQEKKDSREVMVGDVARANLVEGARRLFETVSSTYGPKGRNVMIEKPFGKFQLTRDGVTVARETYFSERGINMGTQVLYEASETTNRIAGDGTTATVVLGYHLLRRGVQAIAAGQHEMEVKDQLLKDRDVLLKELDKLSKPAGKGQLKQVATVSSGDSAVGELIAGAVEKVGAEGGIITEKSYASGIEREYIDGYYLQSGFTALQEGRKELTDPFVIVSSRNLTSAADLLQILQATMEATGLKPGTIPKLLFVGNIDGEAYNAIVDNINRHTIDAIIIKTPPMFGEMGKQLLEDIAAYADCEPISDTTKLDSFDGRYVGTVRRVRASKSESTLFTDELTDKAQMRVEYLESQIKEEIVDAILEKLHDRKAKLLGKVAIFKIGGATDTSKEEIEFRVEDAIHATRAAYTDGVVPGGGVTLYRLSEIGGLLGEALRDTFKQLIINAGMSPDVMIGSLWTAAVGSGYDLRNGDGEVIDVVKAGILDPTMVVRQIITNATQAAADALTTGVQITFIDTETK